MPIKAKHFLIVGGLFTAGVMFYSLGRAVNTGKNLAITVLPRVEKWNLRGLRLLIDAEIQNPTGGTIHIEEPEIALFSHQAEKPFYAVKIPGKTIRILPRETVRLSGPGQLERPILVEIANQTLFRMFPEALAAVAGLGPPFKLRIRLGGTVKIPNLPAKRLFVSETITLKSPIG